MINTSYFKSLSSEYSYDIFIWPGLYGSLRKHDYSNILKILPPKNETFQIKNSDIFHISAQNIDCGYSLEPLRLCLGAEIRKIMYTLVNPSFTI